VKSWDRHQVPRPGATVAVAIGRPIDIAAPADDAAIEAGRQSLERALVALEAQALHMLKKASGGGH
jgi:lysophospholipid acyltransferase (LPLAT)-like uncharacterized protein